MKISSKVALVVTVFVAINFSGCLWLFFSYLSSAATQMELNSIESSAEVMRNVILEHDNSFLVNVKDYSVWDETRLYVDDRNHDFIDSNFHSSTFENLGISYAAVLDDSCNFVRESWYGGEDKELASKVKEVCLKKEEEDIVGSVQSGEMLFSLVGSSIRWTDGTGAKGHIFFGKPFGRDELAVISELINLPLDMHFGDTPGGGDGTLTIQTDRKNAYIYLTLKTLDGTQAHINYSVERQLRGLVSRTNRLYVIQSIVLSVLLSVGVIYLVDIMFIKRIRNLDSTVRRIIQTSDMSQTVHDDSDDEIGGLARSFNLMAGSIDEEQKALASKNQELTDKNEKLRDLDRMKDEFLSSVSHEIRTPLTCISSYAQLLESKVLGPVSAKQRKALAIICESTERMNSLIGDLLDVSRFQSGRMSLCLERCSLRELVKEVALEFDPEIKRLGGRIMIHGDACAHVDKEKMKQLARNLISNSIKYRGEKAPQITVKIQKERPVVLHFIDNGIGIPKEDQGKVFNKFYRVERQDKVSGTGLGLSIVKYIAEAHGGKVELESSEEGTRFTMTLAKVI